MTDICIHGEYLATCHECFDGDPYRAPGTDDYPASRKRSGRIAAVAFLALAALVLLAWRTA